MRQFVCMCRSVDPDASACSHGRSQIRRSVSSQGSRLQSRAFHGPGCQHAVTPSGNVLWSPRLGFNLRHRCRGTAFLRGGAGFFRPADLPVLQHIFETTGLDWIRLLCRGTDGPPITLDPTIQPTSCNSGPGRVFEINYFTHRSASRAICGFTGHRLALPWGMIGTGDLL